MAEKTKNLCAQIPESLHAKVREEQEQRGLTLGKLIEQILNEHYDGGREKTVEGTRTIAFQVPEELYQRLKEYLAREKVSQKKFFVDAIEKALAEDKEDE